MPPVWWPIPLAPALTGSRLLGSGLRADRGLCQDAPHRQFIGLAAPVSFQCPGSYFQLDPRSFRFLFFLFCF